MFYVCHRPRDTDKPWLELPYRRKQEALSAVKTLESQKKEDGTRILNVKLCIGKGRDRREILKF